MDTRTVKRWVLVGLLAAAFLALAAAPAIGLETYSYSSKWGDYYLNVPEGITYYPNNMSVYIADTYNNRVLRFNRFGNLRAVYDSNPAYPWERPTSVAINPMNGDMYVVDIGGHVTRMDSNGTVLSQWGVQGSGPGEFGWLYGVAVSATGDVYVADYDNCRIQQFGPTGEFIREWGSSADSPGTEPGGFTYPVGIDVDGAGNVYVMDSGNGRIEKFTADGQFITEWYAPAEEGDMLYAAGIDVGYAGSVFVADTYNNRVLKFDSSGNLVAKFGSVGSLNGQFNFPEGVAAEGSEFVFVLDTGNDRVQRFIEADHLADTVPPVTISNVTDIWHTSPPRIILTANDSSGIGATYYSLDGGAPATEYVTPIDVYEDGYYTLKYYSVDDYGNAEAVKTQAFRVDRTPPTTTDDHASSYNNEATINLSAQDALSGLVGTRWRLDGSDWTTGTVVATDEIGNHMLEYQSLDVAGNWETTKTVSFTVLPVGTRYEETDPNISYLGPWIVDDDVAYSAGAQAYANQANSVANIAFYGTSITLIAGRASDRGILYLTLDEGEPVYIDLYSPTRLPQQKVWSATNLPEGEHLLQIHTSMTKNPLSTSVGIAWDAVDIAGTIMVAPDKNAPVTTTNIPDGWRQPPFTVELTATDDISGVSSSTYRIDGGPWTAYTGPFQITQQGATQVEYYSIDNAGNTEIAKMDEVWLDATPPSSRNDAPGEWVKAPGIVHLTATDALSGVGEIRYSISGGAWQKQISVVPISAEGTQTLEYYAVDKAGNRETTQSVVVRVDATPPSTLSDVQPSYIETATIHLTAGDALSGIGYTQWRIDEGEWTTGTVATISGPDAWGMHTIEYASFDAVGNGEPVQSATFFVEPLDTDHPTTIAQVPSGWVRGPVDITLSAEDTTTGVRATYYRVNGGGVSEYAANPVRVTEEGTSTLEYWSVDNYGNVEPTRTATVRVDNGSPGLGNDAPSSWVRMPVLVNLTAIDGLSGVVAHTYALNGADPVPYTGAILLSEDGQHSISQAAVDAAGNASSAEITVRMDATPPFTSSNVQAAYTATATVALTAFDGTSGVASTEWRLDGGDWNAGTMALIPNEPGSHTLEWRSTDNAGNAETTQSATFLVIARYDQALQDVAFAGPWATMNDASMVGGSYRTATAAGAVTAVRFSGTRVDWIAPMSNSYGIARVMLDGVEVAVVDQYRASYANKQIVWSSGVLADGVHDLRIEVLGQKRPESTGSRIVVDAFDVAGTLLAGDATPPGTTFQGPGEWSSAPVTISLEAADASGVESTFYRINGGPSITYTGPIAIEDEGVTTITYWSSDRIGNTETPKTATVGIDRNPPSSAAEVPAGWARGPLEVALTSSDQLSGVAELRYSLDGGPEQVAASTVTVTGEGTHTLVYYAVDKAGNVEATKSAEVRLDDTAPTTVSNAQASYSTTATVTLSSTDSLSGVARTEYRLDGAGWATGTSVVIPSSPGIHVLEWRSTDAAGNAEDIRSATMHMSGRVDQADYNASWQGAWATISDPSMVGGGYKTTTAAGPVVNLAFTGARIDWIAPMSNSYGKARVILDGVEVAVVDQYRSTYANKQVVWSSGVIANGEHTLTIEALGEKRAESAGTRIVIDAFDVVGTLQGRTIDDRDEYISWSRMWASISDQAMTGGGYRTATDPNASADIAFVGTGIKWIAPKAPNYGRATVLIDGVVSGTVDLYAASYVNKQVVFDSGVLPDGPHTMRIVTTGDRNPLSSGTRVVVDALSVRGVLSPYVFDQSNPVIGWEGQWTLSEDANMVGGSYRHTTAAGLAANVAFTGTRIDWVAPMSTNFGKARILLDGVEVAIVDQYRSVYANKQTVWSSGTLPYGTHYVRIEVLGEKRPESTDTRVVVDAFRIIGSPSMWRYDAQEARIAASSGWVTLSDPNMTGGTYSFASSAGTQLYVSFTGSMIEWIAPKSINYGKADLYLDGEKVATVDQYRSAYANKQIVWSSGELADGPHTLRIEPLGEKAPESAGTMVVVDAFDIAGVLTSADVFPPVTTSNAQPRYVESGVITLSPKDQGSGVASTSYRVDGGSWNTGTSVALSTLGTHTVEFFSTDAVGNREETRTATVAVVRRIDDAAASSRFSGGWTTLGDPSMWGGTYRFSSLPGASFETSFTGNSFEWIAPKSINFGKADVYLDGVKVATVSQYSPTYKNKQVIWSSGQLEDGPHDVRIVVLGEAEPGSSDTRIVFDCFDLMGSAAGFTQ